MSITGGQNAREPFSGTSDTVKQFKRPMTGFVIVNDGSSALTFTIAGNTFTVYGGETFEENFDPFLTVTVNTTVPFRAYGRSWA